MRAYTKKTQCQHGKSSPKHKDRLGTGSGDAFLSTTEHKSHLYGAAETAMAR